MRTSANVHPATTNYLVVHPDEDPERVEAAVRDLVEYLRSKHPEADVDALLGYKGRSTADELRVHLIRRGYSQLDVDTVVPRTSERRFTDHELAASGMTPRQMMLADPGLAASRAKRLAGMSKPLTGAALTAARLVVEEGLSVKAAARAAGCTYNTANWSARSLRFQRGIVAVPAKRGRPVGSVGPVWSVAKCGTTAGYYRHRRQGTAVCDACQGAVNEYQREYYLRQHPDGPGPRVAQCGTPSGYKRHRAQGTAVCDACREAVNEAQREYLRRRRSV